MTLKFTKMHGLGNDFMVIDAIHQSVNFTPQQITQLAHRHTGIGFDQCLLIEASPQPDIDFFYRIYNADGSEVGQCGNGARCLARFVRHYGLSIKKEITVATKTTTMNLIINADETVTVNMGIPAFEPEKIPLATEQRRDCYTLTINDQVCSFHAVSLGNPHAVLFTEDVARVPVANLGKSLSQHAFFPEQCNIGFMQRQSPSQLSLRVYERGAEETLACGSGAAAAAAVGMLYYDMQDKVVVSLPGGDLTLFWPDQQGPIFLTGRAEFIYKGQLL